MDLRCEYVSSSPQDKVSVANITCSAEAFNVAYASHLKRSGNIEVPSWVDLVKTGLSRNSNFLTQTGTTSVQGNFYERSQPAAVPRSYIYVGIGALTKLYGGRNRHGNRPSHHADFSASAQNLCQSPEKICRRPTVVDDG
ncbi:hypothetical protein EDB19DRAFT_2036544 [Suillus lakei]|nr:hypothetical protein EDB19DRAFT_2036544 [Suillus lakei]